MPATRFFINPIHEAVEDLRDALRLVLKHIRLKENLCIIVAVDFNQMLCTDLLNGVRMNDDFK